MTPSPILKALSILSMRGVHHLLMGGQECVLYGAAEFSRDTDVVIALSETNLVSLTNALDELQAACIAVPPLSTDFLDRGHAVHFRCKHPEVSGLRIDVMARLRGVAPFEELWRRRTTMEIDGLGKLELMSLPDLVQAKKTQLDKDWPMIRRLVESDYAAYSCQASLNQVRFWMRESRTPTMILDLAKAYPGEAVNAIAERALIQHALTGNCDLVEVALLEEERLERQRDRAYWKPLRLELEQLRHQKIDEGSRSD